MRLYYTFIILTFIVALPKILSSADFSIVNNSKDKIYVSTGTIPNTESQNAYRDKSAQFKHEKPWLLEPKETEFRGTSDPFTVFITKETVTNPLGQRYIFTNVPNKNIFLEYKANGIVAPQCYTSLFSSACKNSLGGPLKDNVTQKEIDARKSTTNLLNWPPDFFKVKL